jgi:hypothetical protein
LHGRPSRCKRRRGNAEHGQRGGQVGRHHRQLAQARPEQAAGLGGGQERAQRRVVVAVAEQHGRLLVLADLAQREHLEQLVERAEAARQHQEGVGARHQLALAARHVVDDEQLGEPRMRQLAGDHAVRDHADHAPARAQRRVGQHAHQPDRRAAVHQLDAGAGQGPAGRGSQRRVARIVAGPRREEHGDRRRRHAHHLAGRARTRQAGPWPGTCGRGRR